MSYTDNPVWEEYTVYPPSNVLPADTERIRYSRAKERIQVWAPIPLVITVDDEGNRQARLDLIGLEHPVLEDISVVIDPETVGDLDRGAQIYAWVEVTVRDYAWSRYVREIRRTDAREAEMRAEIQRRRQRASSS